MLGAPLFLGRRRMMSSTAPSERPERPERSVCARKNTIKKQQ